MNLLDTIMESASGANSGLFRLADALIGNPGAGLANTFGGNIGRDPIRRTMSEWGLGNAPQGGSVAYDIASGAGNMAGQMIPGIGDVGGFAQDIEELQKNPTLVGALLAAAGLLPLVPSGLNHLRQLKEVDQNANMFDTVRNMGPLSRPLDADYKHPAWADADASGRPSIDIDGADIHPDAVIVGRRNINQDDIPISQDELVTVLRPFVPSIDLDTFSTKDLGARGKFTRRGSDPVRIRVANDLYPTEAESVLHHEAGHAFHTMNQGYHGKTTQLGDKPPQFEYDPDFFDKAVGSLSRDLEGEHIGAELETLFNFTSNPDYNSSFRTPKNFGYSDAEVLGEQIAEAFRMYQQAPALMKEMYPEVASRLRNGVRNVPHLARRIHFNEFAPGVIGGGAVLGAIMNDDENQGDAF